MTAIEDLYRQLDALKEQNALLVAALLALAESGNYRGDWAREWKDRLSSASAFSTFWT